MAQVLPRLDEFERGSPAPDFGPGLADYLGCLPNTTQYREAVLADFDGGGQPYASETVAGEGLATGFYWRRLVPTDQSVELQVALDLSTNPFGTLAPGLWTQRFGVIARMTAGTLAGSFTLSQRLEDITAYGAYAVVNSGAGTITWKVVRWKAGVETTLRSLGPVDLFDPSLQIDFTKVNGIQLTVANVGGIPVVSAVLSRVIVNGALAQNFPIGDAFVDLSGDAITTQGRAGFIISTDYTFEPIVGFGATGRQKAVVFEVRDFTGASDQGVVLRDEFVRQADNGLDRTDDDAQVGPSHQGAYGCDLHTKAGTGAQLVSGPGNSATIVGTLGSFNTPIALARRPPDDPRSQTPYVEFDMTATSAGTNARRGAGVIVHGSGIDEAVDLTGYVVWAYFDTPTNDWNIQVLRYVNGNGVLIAEGSGTLAGLSAIQQISLEVEAGPLPGQPTLDGPVRLQVRAGTGGGGGGGAAQTLTLQAVPGIVADGTYIVDTSSDRVTQGGEGFVGIAWDVAANIRVWEYGQNALLDPGTAANDLPNVALAAEADGATGTLNDVCRIVFPYAVADEFVLQRWRMDSGHVATLLLDADARRRWSNLRTYPMTETEWDAFRAFWDAHEGNVVPFTFNDEQSGDSYTARFVAGTLEFERLFLDTFVARFSLEEVIS